MSGLASNRPVAVIGAGFSGTMAALHLLRRIGDRSILLCERGDHFARGIAYATDDPGHLLNVRAINMSAFPDRPGHFLEWLNGFGTLHSGQAQITEAGTFVSRRLYGDYLTGLLSEAIANVDGASRLILVPDEVVDLIPEPGGYRLVLAGGNSHAVAGAVLAAGHLLPATDDGPISIANPWATTFTEGLRNHEPVVVIGTGLSMVDIALRLQRSGYSGPVIAISRRGLRAHTHMAATAWPAPTLTARESASPAYLLRRLRREVAEAARRGMSWHDVVDSLRPMTSELWRGFSRERQDSFLRHARPWWDIHRHRMAPSVGSAVDAMLASGFLTIHAGHIVEIRVHEDNADVFLRPRARTDTTKIKAQRVINAVGAVAPDRCGSPLIKRLFARGLVQLDRNGLGLDQSPDLCVTGADGAQTPSLWALGPLGKGVFWECVAVPDIRQQAVQLADAVARSFAQQIEA